MDAHRDELAGRAYTLDVTISVTRVDGSVSYRERSTVEVASDHYVEVIRALKDLDAVESLYTSSGDHMLMAEVRAPDGDAVGEVISDRILTIEGVEAAHLSFLQERLK